MRLFYTALIVTCFHTMLFGQQEKQNSLSKNVRNWVENYFISNGFFHDKNDYSKKLTTLTSKEIQGMYYINFIEKQDFDSIAIYIYHIGLNVTNFKPIILIEKTYKDNESKFLTIGLSPNDIDDLKETYLFFDKYNKFTEHTKLKCYERLIVDYIYLRTY